MCIGMPRSQHTQSAPEGQAGIVKRIHIQNFMCHDNLEVNLNQRINFICGKNGSGKSAIQTALAIGLGGKALSTNRGSSLKDLIKNGKNSASIEIALSNLGVRAYKYDEYGSEITVLRNLTQNSSNYKIKTKTGIAKSLGREELNKMLAQFNIQVNNPISILHQDTARNFLNSSDPHDKYKFFIQATQLDEINRMNLETNINVGKVIEDIKKKNEALQITFEDVKATESRLKILEQAKAKAKRRDELENELFWALVAEATAVLKQKQEKKKNLLEQIEALKLKLSDQGGEKTQLTEELENLMEESNKVAIEEDDVMAKCNKKREEVRERNSLYQNKKKECSMLEARLGKLNENLKACENEINKFINSDKDKVQQKEENERKLVVLKEELASVEAAEKTTTVELNQLEDTLEKIREEENQHITSFQNTQFEIRKRNERINRLTKESDNLSEYHPAMPQIVKLIEKAFKDGKFTEKPLGPVGKFVSVVDESWAAPIENFLGRSFLSSFCVNSYKDVAVLKSILSTCCGSGPKPDIICSKFLNKVHDVSRNEVKTEGYSNVLRSLKISDPIIENFIIDQADPESVLMIPTSEEAYRLMGIAQYVPKNCKRSFTKKGDIFYPYPDYRSYASTMKSKSAMLLQSNNADIVKALKQQITDLNNVSEASRLKRKEIEKRKIQVENALLSINKRMEKLQTKKMSLRGKINEIQLALHEPDYDTGISILTDEKSRIQILIGETEAKHEATKSEVSDLKNVVQSLNSDYSQQKKTIEEVSKRKATIQKRIEEINDTIREMTTEKHKHKKILKEKEDLVSSLEDEIKNEIELVDKRTHEAIQLCERIETTRNVAQIQKELKPIKQYLDRLEEESGGSYEEVGKEFYEKKAKFDEISESLARLETFFVNTKTSLKLRTETVKRIQEISAISTQHYFQAYLRQRNFKGIMEFSHEKKELKICVSPLGRDNMMTTSSLSGGEKSYSTVCFIMALWAELNFPFYFLDEFDVYMDMITRRTIMDMLITCAKDMFTSQFVFLTPLDMSNIHVSDDISVHKMTPPRR